MPTTVGVNKMSTVHKGSEGTATVFPDVCKTPAPPAPFIPIPYPNNAPPLGASGTTSTKTSGETVATKSSSYRMSTGDEPGTMSAFAGLSDTGPGMVIMDQLMTQGFTKRGAALMVEGKPVEASADQILLYAILNRRRTNAPVKPPSP